ncbi:MAG TPA: hypothetical protein VF342_10340 [Alphaproteobacteria bacterium]
MSAWADYGIDGGAAKPAVIDLQGKAPETKEGKKKKKKEWPRCAAAAIHTLTLLSGSRLALCASHFTTA